MRDWRWLLVGLADLLRSFWELCARIVQGLALAFGVNLSSGISDFLGFLLAILLIAGFLRRLLQWDHHANQPMHIVLSTNQTPIQVMTHDLIQFGWMVLRVSGFIALLVIAIAF